MSDDARFVYLMRRADRRWKVGFSTNPKARRKSLGSFFAIVEVWQTPQAWQVEQIAHRLLRDHLDTRVPGRETYRAPKAVVLAAIEEAIRIASWEPVRPIRTRKRCPDPVPDPRQEAKIAALVERYARKMESING